MATFTTIPPASSYFGEDLERIPRVQVLTDDGNPVTGVPVAVAVTSVEPASIHSTLLFDCTTAATAARLFTLEDERLRGVCEPVLAESARLQVLLGEGPKGGPVSHHSKVLQRGKLSRHRNSATLTRAAVLQSRRCVLH